MRCAVRCLAKFGIYPRGAYGSDGRILFHAHNPMRLPDGEPLLVKCYYFTLDDVVFGNPKVRRTSDENRKTKAGISLDCDSSRLFRDTKLRQVMRILRDIVLALSLIWYLRHVCVCRTNVAQASYELSAKFAQNFAESSQTYFATFARRSHDVCAIFVRFCDNCDCRATVARLSCECRATVARRLHDGRANVLQQSCDSNMRCNLEGLPSPAIIPSYCHTRWISEKKCRSCWMLIWSLMRTTLIC